MGEIFTGRKRIRKHFGKIREAAEMPNLIEVQKSSYDLFLNSGDAGTPQDGEGIQGVFQSVFPIKDFNETAVLEFVRYDLEHPKYDVEECQQRDMTYSAPLKVTLRLIVFDVDADTGAKSVKDIKEQDVYMGDMPLMTSNGTFVVNGTERVIVSQMHRSPGVFFDHDKGKTHSSGKLLFASRVIPYRGSWLDFEFDAKDIVFARIDRRRKLPVTTLLYSLGMDQEQICDYFYERVSYVRHGEGWSVPLNVARLRGSKPAYDIVNAETGDVVAPAGDKLTPRVLKKIADAGEMRVLAPFEAIHGRFAACDIVNGETGEIYAEAGDELDEERVQALIDAGITEIETLDIDNVTVGAYIRNTLAADKNVSRETALLDIYRVMRPGEPPTLEAAETMFQCSKFPREIAFPTITQSAPMSAFSAL
jgi:DNA-directed RNA polymerase subunit beta